MKKIIIAVLVLSVIALTFSACDTQQGKKSSTVIDISSELTYDEREFAEQAAKEKAIEFSVQGKSDYCIIVPQTMDSDLEKDVIFLRGALRKITGDDTAFEIITDTGVRITPCISIGETSFSSSVDTSEVTDDGYAIKSIANDIFIKGGDSVSVAERNDGTANGIYSFLEDQMGCMFVRDDYDYMPSLPTVYLDDIDIVSNPDFRWRRIYQYEVSSNGWSRKIKSNGTGEKSDIGNDANRYWGTWCHSVFKFVPPEEYFESNPEFYAYIDGERRYEYKGSQTQLCLTNPDIYPIIEKNMEEFMLSYPEAVYWDFSINDNMNYCTCDECNRSYEKFGSRAGAMLEIINRLAKKIPDKYISTLAYTYNKDVPRGIECEDNVNIVIAPIETSQLYSCKYGENEASAEAKRMIEEWSAVCDNLFIWDYVVDFKHLLMPYPNFAVQKDNAEFYKENNVKSVFHQGSREQGDELACLRSYVLVKQLWDTDVDVNKLMAKYISVTYGESAPYIAEYLDIMHDSVAKEASELDLYDAPDKHHSDYLDNARVRKYDSLTKDALDAVAGNAEKTEYVQEIRINVLYAMMNAEGLDVLSKLRAFDEFKDLVTKHGITKPCEVAPPDMNEYIKTVYPGKIALDFVCIASIVLACVIVAGFASFAVWWFGIKKRTFEDIKTAFRLSKEKRKYKQA